MPLKGSEQIEYTQAEHDDTDIASKKVNAYIWTGAAKVRQLGDSLGKQIILLYEDPANFLSGNATLTATTDTTIIAAQGAGKRIYITELSISNTSASTVRVDIKDGSTTVRSYFLAASGGGAVVNFPTPLRLSVNVALNAALSSAVTDVRVGASGYVASN